MLKGQHGCDVVCQPAACSRECAGEQLESALDHRMHARGVPRSIGLLVMELVTVADWHA